MEKEIMVKEFVEKYKALPNAAAKSKICKDAIVTSYVPVLDKYSYLVASFYKGCSYDEKKNLRVNYFTQYINYIITVLNMYTNIQVLGEGMSIDESYDALMECGAMDTLLSLVPEEELSEVKRVYDAVKETIVDGELSLSVYFDRKIAQLIDVFEMLGKVEQTTSNEE